MLGPMRPAAWVLVLGLTATALGLAQTAPPGDVREEAVTYLSDGLRVKARVFWPAGEGPRPAVLFNHGGVSGLSEGTLDRCRELAQAGYVVFASSYRGEDGSEGVVEVAKGEVNDVLAGLEWLRKHPRVDPGRIGAVGTSHGALVSLLAASRTDRIKALVFAYGVADIYAWYAYLRRTGQLGNDALTRRTYGDGPQSRPESFRIRHGLGAVAKLPPSMPVLILQGAKDTVVPLEQAQALAKALEARRQPYRLLVYPNSAHGFLINRKTLRKQGEGSAAYRESLQAWDALLGFLRENL